MASLRNLKSEKVIRAFDFSLLKFLLIILVRLLNYL
jgi:hypothetical protein